MKIIYFIFIIFPSLLLTACVPPTGGNQSISIEDVIISEQASNFIYRFGAGDKLRITTYQEEDLSGEFEIDSRGYISMPYIQDVKAKNLTTKELSQAIRRKFIQEKILRDPKISIDVLNYRPFYIHGEVNEGGEYPYKSNMDIRNAVATAGGYTYRASENYALIRRQGKNKILRVDISKVNFLVYPGDNIEIPERIF